MTLQLLETPIALKEVNYKIFYRVIVFVIFFFVPGLICPDEQQLFSLKDLVVQEISF